MSLNSADIWNLCRIFYTKSDVENRRATSTFKESILLRYEIHLFPLNIIHQYFFVGILPLESLDSQIFATPGLQSEWRRAVSQTHNLLCAAEFHIPTEDNTGLGNKIWRLSSCTLEKKDPKKDRAYQFLKWNL